MQSTDIKNDPKLISSSIKYAKWVNKVSESEIRRLLRFSPRYYFAGGQPGIIPVKTFHKIIRQILDKEEEFLEENNVKMLNNYIYGMTEGSPRLREVLAKRLQSRDKLKNITPSMVTITTGSQQMLYSICDSLLNPGDIVIAARPTYLGFVQPAEKLGGRILTLPSDDRGIIPEYIPIAFEASIKKFGKKPKLLYCVPYSDNPKGTTLTLARKKAILDYAYDLDFLILEDAAYKEIQFDSTEYTPIKKQDHDNDRVAYVSTSTKEAAAFRIGYSVLPSDLKDAIIKAKGFYDLCSSEWVQSILTIYYEEFIDTLLPQIRQSYRKRRDAMLDAVDSFLQGHSTRPTGGFFLWYEVNDLTFDSSRFIQKCIQNDVMYVPGAAFYPKFGFNLSTDGSLNRSIPKFNSLRLGYSLLEPMEITKGIECLGSLIKNHIKDNKDKRLTQSSSFFSSLYY
ncbi:MAG: PLP-dependent aminotransferase family protein [Candidatus Hodarchaeota archaeon]